MPILTDDIKLLKSQVMADTADGGGAMTANAIADGVSNNLFPDTSAVDRALGRVNIRQIFGVAQTNDNDSLLGTHAMVVAAPQDPLVHCTLMPAPRWGASRTEYKEQIERYLVKGPIIDCYVFEAHYAGSVLVRFFTETPTELPVGGDAIVIRKGDGSREQYARVLRVALSIVKAGKRTVTVGACELGQALEFDFPGKNPADEDLKHDATTTAVHSTTISGGAQFYGVKPLGVAATTGQYQVTTSGGIFAPLVPAATVESPLVDQYPLTLRQTLSRTARRALVLPPQSLALGAGVVVSFPTAIEPGSISMAHGSATLTDDGSGNLKQGTATVGVVDYSQKTATLQDSAPNYGTASCTISYKPATIVGAGTHSDAQEVTVANQGLVFTNAFEPPPAPGTFTLSYMAQGRWYVLEDNGNGKLAGADTSYGVGTISYGTGSIGVTLGALPDVGSALVYQWGDVATAVPFIGDEPARLSTYYELTDSMRLDTLTIAWARGATNYSATVAADGTISGDATGTVYIRPAKYGSLSVSMGANQTPRSPEGLSGVQGGSQVGQPTAVSYGAAASVYAQYGGTFTPPSTALDFSPNVLPSGDITLTWGRYASAYTLYAGTTGGGTYNLPTLVSPGSISAGLPTIPQAGMDIPAHIDLRDDRSGNIVGRINNQTIVFGSVNYATGVAQLNTSVVADVYENTIASTLTSTGATLFYEKKVLRVARTIELYRSDAVAMSYRLAATNAGPNNNTATISNPAWKTRIPTRSGYTVRTDGLAFKIGSDVYFGDNGSVRKGWNSLLNTPVTAAAGVITDDGTITVTALPTDGVNTLTISNAAIDLALGGTVGQGVFRVASAPLKTGVFQIQAGALVGSANGAGTITGGGWTGTVDYARGIVKWRRAAPTGTYTLADWNGLAPIKASELSYNAVFLQYLPLDATLLGLNTARLPLDGKVPIYRAGALVVVHNTLAENLANPLSKGTAYNLNRNRIASVRVKTVTGVVVPSGLYTVDYNLGRVTVPVGSDITALPQPWTVEHRIEDLLTVTEADISGRLKFTRSLTHDYPANSSFVSSALPFGDLFGRVSNVFDQQSWTGEWSDERIGSDTLASYNTIDHPITTTNRGAVTERWALIFTSNTAFRIVGENYGQVGTGDINTICQPINTAAGAPFFSIPVAGWGGGWVAGNVLRKNTNACGAAFGVVRTVLQGPDTLASDQFTLAFRADVNA